MGATITAAPPPQAHHGGWRLLLVALLVFGPCLTCGRLLAEVKDEENGGSSAKLPWQVRAALEQACALASCRRSR